MANDLIDHTHVNEASRKTQKDWAGRASRLVKTWMCWEGSTAGGSMAGSSARFPPYLALRVSSIWLFLSSILSEYRVIC